jgi:hypothetical protein
MCYLIVRHLPVFLETLVSSEDLVTVLDVTNGYQDRSQQYWMLLMAIKIDHNSIGCYTWLSRSITTELDVTCGYQD